MTDIQYSDLDFKLRKISSSGDVYKVTNETAINQALLSLFNTNPGERVFNPEFGCGIRNLLFEPLDKLTANSILDDLKSSIFIWEPRIQLTELSIKVDYDNSSYNVFIEYQIINTLKTGTLEFTLKKV